MTEFIEIDATRLVLVVCGEVIDFNQMARVRELLKQVKREREVAKTRCKD